MKKTTLSTLIFAACLTAYGTTSTPSFFENLGFDSANTNNSVFIDDSQRYFWGDPQAFLTGWKLSGNVGTSRVGVNASPIGYGYVSLYQDDRSDGRFWFSMVPLFNTQMSLSQNGVIPEGAKAIHFVSLDAHVGLSLDGNNVPLVYVPRYLFPPPSEGSGPILAEVNDVYGDVSPVRR